MVVGEPSAAAEVRTYVSRDMANLSLANPKIVTRRAAAVGIATIVAADAAGNLVLHQAMVEKLTRGRSLNRGLYSVVCAARLLTQ